MKEIDAIPLLQLLHCRAREGSGSKGGLISAREMVATGGITFSLGGIGGGPGENQNLTMIASK